MFRMTHVPAAPHPTNPTEAVNVEAQRREAAQDFAAKWAGRGYEKGDTSSFWLELLSSVVGMEDVTTNVRFEQRQPPELRLQRIDCSKYAIADDSGTDSGYRGLLRFDRLSQ